MIREPFLFMNSRFVVDHFHWKDHTACARAFNPSIYAKLVDVNTSAAEQLHSRLQRIKAQVSYMRQANFMEYTRHFLYMSNLKTKKIAVAQTQLQ